jgi:peptide chain release factor subunit 1
MESDGSEAKSAVEQFRMKRLIKKLETARGNGTSMISLIIPPKKQISDITKLLTDEIGKASNIKDRVNRQSVVGAMTSSQQRLKLYKQTPNNGLVLFCGTIFGDDGKTEKKLMIDFEPFRAVNTSLYYCDNKFHVGDLKSLLENDDVFGFIIVDGNGALYGSVQGNTKEVLNKFTVELPKKHGRGGQSSVRFARLRLEKRHNYLRKVCEVATQVFITNDRPNIKGLVVAGSADFKTDLVKTDMFDQRLLPKVIKIVDVGYGGENGFDQALEMSRETMLNVKFMQERKVISSFFEQIAMDTGMVVYSVQDCIKALEMSALERLILYENLDILRVVMKFKDASQQPQEAYEAAYTADPDILTKTRILYLTPSQVKDNKYYKDNDTKLDLELVDQEPLSDWFLENYEKMNITLHLVTDKSAEGAQFVKGFGGIAGFLRYKIEIDAYDQDDMVDNIEDDFI